MTMSNETSETVSKWASMVKQEVEFVPKTMLIYCGPVKINAIRVIFQESVRIFLCH